MPYVSTLLAADFEAGEGFVLGPIDGQNGYGASGAGLPWASVSNLNPSSGAQHLRLVFDGTVSQGTSRVVLSPTIVAPPNSPSQTTQQIFISNDGGADYDAFGQAPSQAFITWRVKFSYSDDSGVGPGTIYILDNTGVLVFVNTGVTWTEGAYRELKVQFDPAAGEIRYFYNAAMIYTGSIFAGTAVEQIGWLSDNFQLANERCDVDAVLLIDTATPPVPVQTTTWSRVKAIRE